MELGTVTNIVGCVSAGVGVTLLPKGIINSISNKGAVRVHKVTDEDCRAQTLFIRRRDGFVSSALSAFLNAARVYAQSLAAT